MYKFILFLFYPGFVFLSSSNYLVHSLKSMKLSSATFAAIIAYTALTNAAPAPVGSQKNQLEVRQVDHEALIAQIESLSAYKVKRDSISDELQKREYEIVTEVLSALNDTNYAPKIIKYLATNSVTKPITVNTIVAVLKSGKVDLSAVLSALVDSGLINTVIGDVISDCTIYEKLFALAKSLISNLKEKVTEKIEEGVTSFTSKRDNLPSIAASEDAAIFDKRADSDSVVINLLQSLGNSGLASSVVESILTDSSYIPFATELIEAVLSSDALDITDVISAVKESGLLGSLFKQIFSKQTLQDVTTTAFAAYKGTCDDSSSSSSTSSSSSSSGSSDSSSGSSDSTTTTTASTNPCKKRRRRRRRHVNAYNN